jgi:hypothetical protein
MKTYTLRDCTGYPVGIYHSQEQAERERAHYEYLNYLTPLTIT